MPTMGNKCFSERIFTGTLTGTQILSTHRRKFWNLLSAEGPGDFTRHYNRAWDEIKGIKENKLSCETLLMYTLQKH